MIRKIGIPLTTNESKWNNDVPMALSVTISEANDNCGVRNAVPRSYAALEVRDTVCILATSKGCVAGLCLVERSGR